MLTTAGLAASAMPSTSIDADDPPDEYPPDGESPDQLPEDGPELPRSDSVGRNGDVAEVADEAVSPPHAVSATRPSAADPHTTTTAAMNSATQRSGDGRPAAAGTGRGAGDSSYDMAPALPTEPWSVWTRLERFLRISPGPWDRS